MLQLSSSSLKKDDEGSNEYQADQIRNLVYTFYKTIESTAEWISARENSRQSIQNSKMDESNDRKQRIGLNDLNTEMENDGQTENSSNDEVKKCGTIREIHQCNLCVKSYKLASSLRVHKQTAHSDEKPYKCDICGKTFNRTDVLYSHKKNHLPNQESRKIHECKVCGKRFKESGALNMHKISHLDSEEDRKPFKCDSCGKRFAKKAYLKKHTFVHRDKNDPNIDRFKCDECGMNFYRIDVFKDHMRIHNDDENVKRPYACDICGMRFTLSGAVGRHKIRKHLPDDHPSKRKHICEICGKSFPSAFQLTSHKKTHLDISDPKQAKIKNPFPCDICGKSFRSVQKLRIHKNTHAGVYDHAIILFLVQTIIFLNFCDFATSRDSYDVTVRIPFVCDTCGKRFSQLVHLRGHERIHSNDPDVKRPYECDLCGAKFTQSSTIKVHKRSHCSHLKRKEDECKETSQIYSNKTKLTETDDEDSEESDEEEFIGMEDADKEPSTSKAC